MLLRAASVILINAEKRRLIEVLPDSVKEVFKEWEVQVLILVSLTLQIVLILLGKRRQFVGRIWIRITLWIAYLLADWVATVALGVISQDTLDKCQKKSGDANRKDELMSFWAPFMLLHLGGPDTITAYSLEDNELWLRHLVSLIMQSGLVLYILLVALPGSSWLPILSLPVLISGLIKYCERTWALRSAKMENLRDSILTPPDPGPNYAKFMEEFNLKKAEGYFVMADEVKEIPVPIDHSYKTGEDKLLLVSEAYNQFQTFNRLFVDLILSFQDRDNSQSYFQKLKPKEAFDVIEAELGFAYDTFYTKAPVIHTSLGCILRAVTFSCTCFSLISFSLLRDKSNYHILDLILTYMLLVVAFLLEIYALISLLKSDLTQIWLSKDKHDGNFHQFLLRKLCLQNNNNNNNSSSSNNSNNNNNNNSSSNNNNNNNSNNNNNNNSSNNNNNNIPDANSQVGFEEGEITPSSKMRWSNCTPQYNLLRYCLVFKPAPCFRLQKLFMINEILEKHRYTKYEKVSPHLKALIFNHFRKFAVGSNEPDPTALCKRRGSVSLNENASVSLVWSTEVEFDQSILIWHIATDLCYHLENNTDESTRSKHSKQLSDYMLYLLVVCPFMLPIGIGMIRFRDTCAEAKEFFKGRKLGKDIAKACNKLLAVSTDVAPAKVKGDRSKSVLFDACVLAKALQEKEKEHKWKIISEVWVEILAYAATHCRGNHHAHQLRKGGELLTHVWLLMAHLGITEQFQIYRGHARAKLIVK